MASPHDSQPSTAVRRPRQTAASDEARATVADIVARADARERERSEQQVEQAEVVARGSFLARPSTLAGLVAILAGVTAANAYFAASSEPPAGPEAIEVSAARMNLAIIAQEVEAYVEDNGQPPASLDEFGYEDDNVSLTRTGNGYQLTSTEVDPPLVYVGGTDPADLLSTSVGSP